MLNLKNKWLLGALTIIPLWVIYTWLSGPSGLLNQYTIRNQNSKLEIKVDSLATEKVDLDKERAKLRNDTLFLEKIIRKELGMAKKNETVYVLYNKNTKNNNTP